MLLLVYNFWGKKILYRCLIHLCDPPNHRFAEKSWHSLLVSLIVSKMVLRPMKYVDERNCWIQSVVNNKFQHLVTKDSNRKISRAKYFRFNTSFYIRRAVAWIDKAIKKSKSSFRNMLWETLEDCTINYIS